jgi:hypothetical protein
MKTLASLRCKTLTIPLFILPIFAFLYLPAAYSQTPLIEWERKYGIGEGYSMVQTSEKKYSR